MFFLKQTEKNYKIVFQCLVAALLWRPERTQQIKVQCTTLQNAIWHNCSFNFLDMLYLVD